jgi:hypothetical protein
MARGEERPVEAILRHVERTVEREQEARAARRRRVVAWEAEAPG